MKLLEQNNFKMVLLKNQILSYDTHTHTHIHTKDAVGTVLTYGAVIVNTYGAVIVNTLRPAMHVHESVHGSQFASEQLLPLGVIEPLQPPDVIDGGHTLVTCGATGAYNIWKKRN